MTSVRPLPIALVALVLATPVLAQGTTERVSLRSDGAQGNDHSYAAAITPDGRFVAFRSGASNLVALDTNPFGDVFVRDRQGGTTALVSLDSAGAQGGADSGGPSLSADGTRVAFYSTSDLAPGATPLYIECFVRDIAAGTTELVGRPLGGQLANGYSMYPSLSADGRWVAFECSANNLVAGDAFRDVEIFLRDLQTQTTLRVTHQVAPGSPNSPSYAPAVSGDGRLVAFQSYARLLPEDQNWAADVYLFERLTGALTLVSRGVGGAQANASSEAPRISSDGSLVTFSSAATNLVALPDAPNTYDAFLYEVASGSVTRLDIGFADGQANGQTVVTSLSGDGRFLGLYSFATNVFPFDLNAQPDALLHDRTTGATLLCSRKTAGWQGGGGSSQVAVSDDGRTVAFHSAAADLVAGDTNGKLDVFVHRVVGDAPVGYCSAKTNSLGCVPALGTSGTPSLSSAAPFTISAQQVLSQQPGLLFYGFAPALVPFQGGLRCVQQPVERTALQFASGPAQPPDCSGTYAFDFNALLRSGADPRLAAGTVVYAQYWTRDLGSASGTGLTDAAAFGVLP